jgi:hypothetical protein
MEREDMTEREKLHDLARGGSQPSGDHGDLPRPTTGPSVEDLPRFILSVEQEIVATMQRLEISKADWDAGVGFVRLSDARKLAEALEQRVIALTQIISTYGQHLPTCQLWECRVPGCQRGAEMWTTPKCTCGFLAALDATKAP